MELEKMLKQLDIPIKRLGVDMVNEIIDILKSKDKIASGELIKSVKYEYIADIDNIELLIKSEDYLTYVDQGRRPGKYVPVNALRKWAKLKGIPEKAVYPINHKIFKFGIRPLNFMKRVSEKYKRPDKFGVIIKQYNKIVADYLKWEFQEIQKNMK